MKHRVYIHALLLKHEIGRNTTYEYFVWMKAKG